MDASTVSPRPPSLNRVRKAIAHLSVYAGLSLIPLLFIGMWLSFTSPWFDYLFFAHAVLLLTAVAAVLVFYWRCAHAAKLSILVSLGSFIIFLLVIILESTHPITSRDALIHHLAVPKWWLEAGKILPITWHEWSFYPMLIQMGFTGLMKFGLDQWTPLYHFCYLLLTCGVIASFTLYKTQDYDAAIISFLITLTIPVCLRLATTPMVDLGLALYTAQALCHFVYWAEGKHRKSHLLIAGASLGLAMSCKYNGLLACALAILVAVIYTRRSGLRFGMILGALFITGSMATIVYFPWMLKNATWTSNPFYPLMNGLFAISSGPSVIGGLSPLAHRLLLYQEGFLDLLTIPLQMLFLGEDGNPQKFDGVLSPILLLCLVPLYHFRKQPWIVYFVLYCFFYFCFALVSSSARVRYLAPLFGPLIILASVGVWHCSRFRGGKFARETYMSVAAFSLLWSGWHAGSMLSSSDTLSYLQGSETKEEYLRTKIAEFPSIQFVNANVPDGSTVYLLHTGNRYYYFDKKVFSSGHFSANQALRWIKTANTARFLTAEFSNRGIDYLMTNTELTRRTFTDSLDATEQKLWNDFQAQHLELLFVQGPFSVWKIHELPRLK